MSKNRDLKGIAENVVSRSMDNDEQWQPTTRDIEEEYGLNESQSAQVKKYCREIGSEVGALWDYYPPTGRFRIAPRGDSSFARVMLEYRWNAWRDAGKSVKYDMRAARKIKVIPKRMAKSAELLTDQFDTQIGEMMKGIK